LDVGGGYKEPLVHIGDVEGGRGDRCYFGKLYPMLGNEMNFFSFSKNKCHFILLIGSAVQDGAGEVYFIFEG
jgi:hypothetical protein